MGKIWDATKKGLGIVGVVGAVGGTITGIVFGTKALIDMDNSANAALDEGTKLIYSHIRDNIFEQEEMSEKQDYNLEVSYIHLDGEVVDVYGKTFNEEKNDGNTFRSLYKMATDDYGFMTETGINEFVDAFTKTQPTYVSIQDFYANNFGMQDEKESYTVAKALCELNYKETGKYQFANNSTNTSGIMPLFTDTKIKEDENGNKVAVVKMTNIACNHHEESNALAGLLAAEFTYSESGSVDYAILNGVIASEIFSNTNFSKYYYTQTFTMPVSNSTTIEDARKTIIEAIKDNNLENIFYDGISYWADYDITGSNLKDRVNEREMGE